MGDLVSPAASTTLQWVVLNRCSAPSRSLWFSKLELGSSGIGGYLPQSKPKMDDSPSPIGRGKTHGRIRTLSPDRGCVGDQPQRAEGLGIRWLSWVMRGQLEERSRGCSIA